MARPAFAHRGDLIRDATGRRRIVVWLGAFVLLVTGCGSTAARAITDTPSASTATTIGVGSGGCTTPRVTYGTGELGAPDPTTSVPTERGTRAINPSNDAGQEVIIAKGGYLLPEWLVAEVNLPITWTNLSGKPQQISFDDAPVCSATIVPGGTFTWKSPKFAISLRYHTVNGHHAQLTLQSPDNNS
jgi:hypothetical protein